MIKTKVEPRFKTGQMLTKSPAVQAAVMAGASLLVGTFIAMALANWTSAVSEKNVTLVYVGAEDCAPCGIWQRKQGIAFRDSPEFGRLTYREVKSPTLFDVLKEENWPVELRDYRQAIKRGTGAPLWLVIADGQIILQRSGLTQWQEAVLPKLKSLLH